MRHPSLALRMGTQIRGNETKGGEKMADRVYCVKCKQKTEQKHPQRVTLKNGKPAQQGSCAVCGTKTTLMLSAAAAPQA